MAPPQMAPPHALEDQRAGPDRQALESDLTDVRWERIGSILGRSTLLESLPEVLLARVWPTLSPLWKQHLWRRFLTLGRSTPPSFWSSVMGVDLELTIDLEDWLRFGARSWTVPDLAASDLRRVLNVGTRFPFSFWGNFVTDAQGICTITLLEVCWPSVSAEDRGEALLTCLRSTEHWTKSEWEQFCAWHRQTAEELVWPTTALSNLLHRVVDTDRVLWLVRDGRWSAQPSCGDIALVLQRDHVEVMQFWLHDKVDFRLSSVSTELVMRSLRSVAMLRTVQVYLPQTSNQLRALWGIEALSCNDPGLWQWFCAGESEQVNHALSFLVDSKNLEKLTWVLLEGYRRRLVLPGFIENDLAKRWSHPLATFLAIAQDLPPAKITCVELNSDFLRHEWNYHRWGEMGCGEALAQMDRRGPTPKLREAWRSFRLLLDAGERQWVQEMKQASETNRFRMSDGLLQRWHHLLHPGGKDLSSLTGGLLS